MEVSASKLPYRARVVPAWVSEILFGQLVPLKRNKLAAWPYEARCTAESCSGVFEMFN